MVTIACIVLYASLTHFNRLSKLIVVFSFDGSLCMQMILHDEIQYFSSNENFISPCHLHLELSELLYYNKKKIIFI